MGRRKKNRAGRKGAAKADEHLAKAGGDHNIHQSEQANKEAFASSPGACVQHGSSSAEKCNSATMEEEPSKIRALGPDANVSRAPPSLVGSNENSPQPSHSFVETNPEPFLSSSSLMEPNGGVLEPPSRPIVASSRASQPGPSPARAAVEVGARLLPAANAVRDGASPPPSPTINPEISALFAWWNGQCKLFNSILLNPDNPGTETEQLKAAFSYHPLYSDEMFFLTGGGDGGDDDDDLLTRQFCDEYLKGYQTVPPKPVDEHEGQITTTRTPSLDESYGSNCQDLHPTVSHGLEILTDAQRQGRTTVAALADVQCQEPSSNSIVQTSDADDFKVEPIIDLRKRMGILIKNAAKRVAEANEELNKNCNSSQERGSGLHCFACEERVLECSSVGGEKQPGQPSAAGEPYSDCANSEQHVSRQFESGPTNELLLEEPERKVTEGPRSPLNLHEMGQVLWRDVAKDDVEDVGLGHFKTISFVVDCLRKSEGTKSKHSKMDRDNVQQSIRKREYSNFMTVKKCTVNVIGTEYSAPQKNVPIEYFLSSPPAMLYMLEGQSLMVPFSRLFLTPQEKYPIFLKMFTVPVYPPLKCNAVDVPRVALWAYGKQPPTRMFSKLLDDLTCLSMSNFFHSLKECTRVEGEFLSDPNPIGIRSSHSIVQFTYLLPGHKWASVPYSLDVQVLRGNSVHKYQTSGDSESCKFCCFAIVKNDDHFPLFPCFVATEVYLCDRTDLERHRKDFVERCWPCFERWRRGLHEGKKVQGKKQGQANTRMKRKEEKKNKKRTKKVVNADECDAVSFYEKGPCIKMCSFCGSKTVVG